MRILILNWRDIKNPIGGGAEILTHEVAKRWVIMGHQVTQFSAAFPGSQNEEIIDGVRIIRRGIPDVFNKTIALPVHVWAFWFYLTKFRQQFDVVVDEFHGIPFFTPLYVQEKKIALICEVAKDIWDQMFTFPKNLIGKLAEKFYFLLYRKTKFLTISASTKKDLIEAGINKENIVVLPMGVNLNLPQTIPPKNKKPALIFVGRLCKMKGIEDAIEAFRRVVKQIPSARLWIVGEGEKDYVQDLKILVRRKKLLRKVRFFGYVNEKQKFQLMAKARLLVHPSRREGWGLVVCEANSVGTPVVAYNSPGLRDVVKNGVNGVLCRRNRPKDMSENILKLLSEPVLYRNLQKGGYGEIKKASWDKTAQKAIDTIDSL